MESEIEYHEAARTLAFEGGRTMNRPILKSIRISGLLSFGPTDDGLPLSSLNVLIGPNGSGKSNTIEAFALLQAAASDLTKPIREGGGIRDWLWKGATDDPQAVIDVVTRDGVVAERLPHVPHPTVGALRYRLAVRESAHRLEVADERIENEGKSPGKPKPYFYFGYENGRPMVNVQGESRELRRETVDPQQSILSQRKDPDLYPEITTLADVFGRIRIYRDWSFGRYTPSRLPQKADLPNDRLLDDASNLGLVLNRLSLIPDVKQRLIEELRALYDGITDFTVSVEGGTVQLFLTEGRFPIPATRLSDGTLRYLCLLAILCDPKPPPLVCLEEPELGLHPDLLPRLAQLLRDASQEMQLIVTTHSDGLVSALSDEPESVVVCEKVQGRTVLQRLDPEQLKPWLDKYRLGQLWMRGDIGGTRW